MPASTLPAAELRAGDVVDLEGDPFAELPLPLSRIEAYAARRRFGFGFVALVQALDAFVREERAKVEKERSRERVAAARL